MKIRHIILVKFCFQLLVAEDFIEQANGMLTQDAQIPTKAGRFLICPLKRNLPVGVRDRTNECQPCVLIK
jgi:hypothetical protein